jgi:hypothetical protein
MTMGSSNKHRRAALAMAGVFGLAALAAPLRQARADDVGSTGKGIAGGALLGAEVPTIIEGIAGVRSGWVYFLSAVAGAGGGAFGGYEVEKGSSDGKAPMYMLAGGLALIIPAVVLTLNATRYMPEEGATEDRTPGGPAPEPGSPGGSVTGGPAPLRPNESAPTPPPPPPAATPAPAPAPAPPPQSLLDFRTRGGVSALRLGVPAAVVGPGLPLSEAKLYGVKDGGAALHVPVLHIAF